jgi:hypothetical protein
MAIRPVIASTISLKLNSAIDHLSVVVSTQHGVGCLRIAILVVYCWSANDPSRGLVRNVDHIKHLERGPWCP